MRVNAAPAAIEVEDKGRPAAAARLSGGPRDRCYGVVRLVLVRVPGEAV